MILNLPRVIQGERKKFSKLRPFPSQFQKEQIRMKKVRKVAGDLARVEHLF